MVRDPNVRSAVSGVMGSGDLAAIEKMLTGRNSDVAAAAAAAASRIAPPRIRVSKAQPAAPRITKVVPPVSKSDDSFSFDTTIAKFDDEKRLVFGWASITDKDGQPVVDRQGDMIEITEVEKSAYDYVIDSRAGGNQHRRDEADVPLRVSDMVESVVFTPEKVEKMGLPPETPTGWWVGFKVRDDESWDDVKNGRVTGFSVHGKGRRVPVGG